MKKRSRLILILAIAAVLVVLPIAVFAGHDGVATGRANLHPSNQSGVKGKIDFTVVAGNLMATGTATGLTPFEDQFFGLGQIGGYSLVYDNGSRPGGPENPAFFGNCEVVDEELPDMFLGFWLPAGPPDTWVLIQVAGFTTDLGDFDTVSIRGPLVFGPTAVVACGQVADHRG